MPRLGELERLGAAAVGSPELPESPATRGGGWNAGHAWLLAGSVALVVALAAAGWLRGRRLGDAAIDERAIRAAVAALPADHVHGFWLGIEQQGIARPALPDEQRRLRRAEALTGVEIVAWIAAAAGAMAAGVGGTLLAGRRVAGTA